MVMAKKKILAVITAAILVMIIILSYVVLTGIDLKNEHKIFVPKGSSGGGIFIKLKKKGVTDSRFLFMISLKISNLINGPVKPGLYEIKSPVSYFTLGKKFTAGDVAVITFPEGYTPWPTSIPSGNRRISPP